ncbi:MAG: nuclear transport factor 2 family protein [Gaiellaceae bacterium]
MDTRTAAQAWIDAWTRAWRALDAELLAPVYTAETVHRSHPFREPGNPIEYARWAFAEEEGEPEVWMGDPVVDRDRAAIEWWAVVVDSGKQVSLAGTSIVRFDEQGRALEQTDYWGTTDGRVAPWEGWGQTPSASDPDKAAG